MNKSSTAFVGMDVHKDSIEIAIADEGEVRRYGQVGGDASSVDRVVRKLRSAHRDMVFVYEAGPCGFWLQRRLAAQGFACMVCAMNATRQCVIWSERARMQWRCNARRGSGFKPCCCVTRCATRKGPLGRQRIGVGSPT